MFHPILTRYNGCEDSLPCQEPLEEGLLIVGGEVEEVRGNGPSEDAKHQGCK